MPSGGYRPPASIEVRRQVRLMKACGEKVDVIAATTGVGTNAISRWTRDLSRPRRGAPSWVPSGKESRNKNLAYFKGLPQRERQEILGGVMTPHQETQVHALARQLLAEATDTFDRSKTYLTSWRIHEMTGVSHQQVYEAIAKERDRIWRGEWLVDQQKHEERQRRAKVLREFARGGDTAQVAFRLQMREAEVYQIKNATKDLVA
jgi:hypothetical protein